MDILDRQSIYSAIQIAASDPKQLFALATMITKEVRNRDEAIRSLESSATSASNATNAKTAKIEAKERAMGSEHWLSIDATDEQLRARAKQVLIDKLNDATITAAEFAQFKDVFGLASAKDTLAVHAVQFNECCNECQALQMIGAQSDAMQ